MIDRLLRSIKKPSYDQDENTVVLEAKDIKSVAKYMKSDSCRNVFLMLGAGVSTSAGIPDFRSPETGLYANLARLNLPYPEAVFEINFFRRNPHAFYTLAKELYPGRFRPTPTHSFIKLLASHSLLHTCFTQNIDTLERRAGVPANKIIEAHGSFATQRCIDCKKSYGDEKIRKAVLNSEIPRCENCHGLVKPDIVFFGEALPVAFHNSLPSLRRADLLIIIGTSLTVHPFASLVDLVPDDCPRVLINFDAVGDFDRPNDVVCLGKCDNIVRELCRELGWEEELDKEWAATASTVENDEVQREIEEKGSEAEVKKEIDRITKDMEKSLALTEESAEQTADAPHEKQAAAELQTAGEKIPEEKTSEEFEEPSDPKHSDGKL